MQVSNRSLVKVQNDLAQREVNDRCPQCNHYFLFHGTSKGCHYIVRVSGKTMCGCPEKR